MSIAKITDVEFGAELPAFTPDTSIDATSTFAAAVGWGGDRWEVKVEGEDQFEDAALFMILNDHEIIAKVTCSPLEMRSFI